MKIALIGYGKMGHEVEKVALKRGHDIVFRTNAGLTDATDEIRNADAAIEFSQPDAAADNLLICMKKGVPVVCGTTGWYTRLPEIKAACAELSGSLLYSTNFSIGVNIMFHLNKQLAAIMHQLDEYEPGIHEIHHIHKLDKPSGTALTLTEGILSNLKRKKSWTLDQPAAADQLWIHTERIGEAPGTHIVSYESEIDIIRLEHIAKNRVGFALGAVKAAEWLKDKKGSYTMNDFLKF